MTSLFTTAESTAGGLAPRFIRGAIRFLTPWVLAFFVTLILRRWLTLLMTGLGGSFFYGGLGILLMIGWEKILHRRRSLRPFHSQIRYFPVLHLLGEWRRTRPSPALLEVGSGCLGLGELISELFTGCDLRFDGPTSTNMIPVVGSATALPFEDRSFDVVVSVDTLEHIPSREDRAQALSEMLRVCRGAVIVGYPCGPTSQAADASLAEEYQQRGLAVPGWLEEHLRHGLPEMDLPERVCGTLAHIQRHPSESVASHLWVMTREWHPFTSFVLSFLQAGAPALLRLGFQLLSRHTPRPYRQFYLLTPRQ